MERTISDIAGVGLCAQVIQHSKLLLPAIYTEQLSIILVRQGYQVLFWQGQEFVVEAGEIIALTAGVTLDMMTGLSREGQFVCDMLHCDPHLIRGFSGTLLEQIDFNQPGVITFQQTPSPFIHTFNHAFSTLTTASDIPLPIIRHRIEELLFWLVHLGKQCAIPQQKSLSIQVRECLNTAPQRSWSAAEVASRLSLSESVLRRRLASENTVLRYLMTDVRMLFALRLLQATNLPISTIASQTGYESPSRFAERFRKRFGFAPTEIRGHQRTPGGRHLPPPGS